MAIWVFVVFVLFVGVIIAVVAYQLHAKSERREALFRFANSYGLEFAREDPFGLLDTRFTLFSRGDGRGIENVVSGTWQGMTVREADYWYYDEHTDSEGHRTKTYRHFSVVLTDIEADVPHVAIAREGVLSRFAGHVGFGDIQFESEEFNRVFNVKARDREFAFKLIDARMMHWLLQAGRDFGYEVVGAGLLVHSKRRKPTELIPLLGTARAFRDHVPRLVWNQYGGGSQPGSEALR